MNQPSEDLFQATRARAARRAGLRRARREPIDLRGKTLAQVLEELLAADRPADAIRLLAQSLPAREAVWWGCLCVWHTYKPVSRPAVAAALQAALAWVIDPSEGHRRAAEAPARTATLRHPAGCLAMAAFWSGGSMAPVGTPAVNPPPGAAGKVVGAGIVLASALEVPAKLRRQRRHEFLALGREIAAGQLPPPIPSALSSPSEAPSQSQVASAIVSPSGEVMPQSHEAFSWVHAADTVPPSLGPEFRVFESNPAS